MAATPAASFLTAPTAVLAAQFGAALETLRRAVDACPPELWDDTRDRNAFWRVAFHTLWFVDLYSSDSVSAFTPWPQRGDEAQWFGPLHWQTGKPLHVGPPATPADINAYIAFLRGELPRRIALQPLDAPSGFDWLPFSKLELHIYSVRHVQHHAAQLSARLRERAGITIDWVGTTAQA